MTDAPERIWVWPDYNDHFNPVKQDWTHGFWDGTEDPLGTEYVRADHIKAQAAEIERLRVDLKKAQGALHQIAGKKDYADDPWDIARATLAALTGAQKDGN